jgi:aminoglycoside phosphotransferase family enzyme/predicted kinase
MDAESRAHPREAATGAMPEIVRAMLDPGFYPHAPGSVELRQTHISYVFLAGDFAYKVKKPVRFPFLDASKLARRYELCCDEIRLNRRLAPGLYLDVVPIVRRGSGYALGATEDMCHAEEFAVRMRRLDQNRMLDRLIAAGEADEQTMRDLARRLADFHACASTDNAWRYGSAAALWRRVLGDLGSYEAFIGYTVSERELREIEDYCRRFIESQWELLNQRAKTGRVRDGHGDLRAEHICIEPDDTINIYDCVEFSESIRYCDVAADIAFLAMDLDRLDAPRLSLAFVLAYAEASADDDLGTLMPFYKCYRASIRGMAESQRSLAPEVSAPEREQARSLAGTQFAMAHRYAMLAAPAMVVVCGLSGSGKSTLARALRHRLGFEVLNSDVVRKRLAHLPAEVRTRGGYAEGIYTEDFNRRTYAAMLEEAGKLLRCGRGVILDATFRDPDKRRLAAELASRAGVPWLFVECRCDEKEAIARLAERARNRNEVSDADVEVYRHQRTEFAPLSEIPAYRHCTVDTTDGSAAGALEAELRLAGLRSLGGSDGLEAA